MASNTGVSSSAAIMGRLGNASATNTAKKVEEASPADVGIPLDQGQNVLNRVKSILGSVEKLNSLKPSQLHQDAGTILRTCYVEIKKCTNYVEPAQSSKSSQEIERAENETALPSIRF